MGDRGNIAIQYEGNKAKRVYFYTHWKGSDMSKIVAAALERGKGRWGDDSYLARVIFCELVKDDVEGETGYGISLDAGDNEHPFLVVDLESQTVFQESDRREGFEYTKKAHMEPVKWQVFIDRHRSSPVMA